MIRYDGKALMDHPEYESLCEKLDKMHKSGDFTGLLYAIQEEKISAELTKKSPKICDVCGEQEVMELEIMTYYDPTEEHHGYKRYTDLPERYFRRMDIEVDVPTLEKKIRERAGKSLLTIGYDDIKEDMECFRELIGLCDEGETLEDDFTIMLCKEHNAEEHVKRAEERWISYFLDCNRGYIAKDELQIRISKPVLAREGLRW